METATIGVRLRSDVWARYSADGTVTVVPRTPTVSLLKRLVFRAGLGLYHSDGSTGSK